MADIEIIGLAGADVVALAEQIGDFAFGLRDSVRSVRRGPNVVKLVDALDLLLHR